MKATIRFRVQHEPSLRYMISTLLPALGSALTYGYSVDGASSGGGVQTNETVVSDVINTLLRLLLDLKSKGVAEVEVLFNPAWAGETLSDMLLTGEARELRDAKVLFRSVTVGKTSEKDAKAAEAARIAAMHIHVNKHPEFFKEHERSLATEKQKALLTKWAVPFLPWITRKDASNLIEGKLRGWLEKETNKLYVYKNSGVEGSFVIILPAFIKFGASMRYVMTFDFEPEHYQHLVSFLSQGGRTIYCESREYASSMPPLYAQNMVVVGEPGTENAPDVFTWRRVAKEGAGGTRHMVFDRVPLPECCTKIIREKILPIATLMSDSS